MEKANINPSYMKLKIEDSDKYIEVVDSNSETDINVTLNDVSGDEMNNYPPSIDISSIPHESSSGNSEDFKEECIRQLKDDVLLKNLVYNLDVEGNLNDFMLLIKQLASGEFPANNIVLLL